MHVTTGVSTMLARPTGAPLMLPSMAMHVRKLYSKESSASASLIHDAMRHDSIRTTTTRRRRRNRMDMVMAHAASKAYQGSLIGTDMKFGIVVGRFNDLVTKLMLEGALEDFERHGVSRDDVDVVWVPGSFELPVVAKSMAKSGAYDAVVAIGVVVRGATAHYDAVVAGATSGVLGASTDSGVPVIFGVLTCDTMEQALDRAGGKVGNKGGEAAATAIETASVLKQLRNDGKAAKPW